MDILTSDLLKPFPATTFVAQIDGAKAKSLRAFYPRIAKALFFPDYFGNNLDALSDCLSSLEVTGRQEVVLVITAFSRFLEKEKPERRDATLQVLRDAEVAENRYDGISFKVIAVQ